MNDAATQETASAVQRAHMVELTGIQSFTCDDCPVKLTCDYAFDAYNTNGDCLAEK